MKEKIPEESRKEFEQSVLNADLYHWMVDNDRQFLDKIWVAVEQLINQEVEKRIAERMPSEEDIELYASLSFPFEQPKSTNVYGDEFNRPKRFGFKNGVIWLRSRLTPQVAPQVPYKTEGGGE